MPCMGKDRETITFILFFRSKQVGLEGDEAPSLQEGVEELVDLKPTQPSPKEKWLGSVTQDARQEQKSPFVPAASIKNPLVARHHAGLHV